MPVKVIISPSVDSAILSHLDYIEIDAIPAAINSIERAKIRFVDTITTFPHGGAQFTKDTKFFTVEGYVFIYEYIHDEQTVYLLDLFFPGQDWR